MIALFAEMFGFDNEENFQYLSDNKNIEAAIKVRRKNSSYGRSIGILTNINSLSHITK